MTRDLKKKMTLDDPKPDPTHSIVTSRNNKRGTEARELLDWTYSYTSSEMAIGSLIAHAHVHGEKF